MFFGNRRYGIKEDVSFKKNSECKEEEEEEEEEFDLLETYEEIERKKKERNPKYGEEE